MLRPVYLLLLRVYSNLNITQLRQVPQPTENGDTGMWQN